MIKQFNSLVELFEAFPDEQSAIDHLRAIRWGENDEHAHCPHCKSKRVYHFSDGKTHKCGDCRKRFSIKVGTIFQDTKIPLRKWFAAIWSITSHKKGIASTTLAKDLGITQKSAWFVLHRLRHAAATKSFNAPLEKPTEIDESYFGGKEKNKHKSKRKGGGQGGAGKDIVFGMLEREGELRVEHISDMYFDTVKNTVEKHVKPGTTLLTDEHRSFGVLDEDYMRHTVNHSKGEYVRHFFIHTNSIEGAWGLFKRQIYGIHHWVSSKHLSRYLGEMCYRYNLREIDEGERVNDLLSRVEGPLTYKALIA